MSNFNDKDKSPINTKASTNYSKKDLHPTGSFIQCLNHEGEGGGELNKRALLRKRGMRLDI